MKFTRTLLVLLCAVAPGSRAADTLNVAVASNFLQAATEIADGFSKATGVSVRLIPGSTGHLYAQIVAGAPYDVFLAADVARPRALIGSGHANADSFTVYARGYLVLWSRDPAYSMQTCYADFLNGKFRLLAIANPDTAPYGEAARRFLQALGRWDEYADKLAYGENVLQAFQFAASGNTSFGLVAASHALAHENQDATCFDTLPDELGATTTVEQGGVVLTARANQQAAKRFLEYMRTPDVTDFLSQRGYRRPQKSK